MAALESSWLPVDAAWADTQAAADGEWEIARATMIEAWEDFEATGNETFGDETEAQM